MKIAISLLVALLNAALTAYGVYRALPAFSSSFVSAISQVATFVVPFGTAGVYALRRHPSWLWNVAFVANLLIALGAFVVGVLSTMKPAYGSLSSLAFSVGLFPIMNLAFLLYRVPRPTTRSERAVSVGQANNTTRGP